jgi:hypothetical protein
MRFFRLCAIVSALVLAFQCRPAKAAAQDARVPDPAVATDNDPSWRLSDYFYWRINILGYGIYRDVETNSILNADNQLEISRYQAELDIRPDFRLSLHRLELSIKPRAELVYEKWEDGGPLDGQDETDSNFYVNEWLARLMVTDQLFVSYGREALLWGPSYLISPSNPFTKDNGRNNPKIEVPGMDYGRVVWIPSSAWALSLIANTGAGRQKFFTEFEPTYALKLDYTGEQKYFSIIPSYREADGAQMPSHEWRVGFFGGWSASDALLLYMEGNVVVGIDNPNDGPAQVQTLNHKAGDTDILTGCSYTFQMGPTVSLEYYHHTSGCTGPIYECLPPLGTTDPDDILIRKDYGMLQFVDNNIMDALDIIVRLIWDLNDLSSRSIAILEYAVGDHVNFSIVGNYYAGGSDDEFGSTLRCSIFAGVELTF